MTRRKALALSALIATTGSAPAFARRPLPRVDNSAVQPSADADLLKLFAQWERVADEEDRRWNEYADALERAREAYPEYPEAVMVLEKDHPGLKAIARNGSYWENMKWVRVYLDHYQTIDPDEYRAYGPAERLAEIIEANASYMRAKADAQQAEGCSELETDYDRAVQTNCDLRRQILELPARTMDGVTAKARVAERCWAGIDELEADLSADIEAGSATNETFATAVLLDVLRLGQQAP